MPSLIVQLSQQWASTEQTFGDASCKERGSLLAVILMLYILQRLLQISFCSDLHFKLEIDCLTCAGLDA